MMPRLLKDAKNLKRDALIITAHPDDESIFMGGTIAEFKKWRWRILCMTDCDARFNKRRQEELKSAAEIYKRNGSFVTPFMLGIVKKKGRFLKEEMLRKLKVFIRTHGKPDIIFTHNRSGEYGHKTHKLVNEIVKKSRLKNIYTLHFGIMPENGYGAQEAVSLSNRSIAVKRRAIRLYLRGSQKTNLSRLKGLVNRAMRAKEEKFIT
ncbi:MAG: PIG-L family deacetylase [Candidatus Omnitrophica bacterium]|nr:PIG-L family deacetylase [Candidatus Omnitrophota bacterium]MBU4488143.1 PIG-L family deacetylase [Candidatus Omnitrophota bacterium]MCG2704530.1 PIG-L family deacetylase [Candidatus Omnitrophota bacterium]